MKKLERKEVYEIVDEERDYQDEKWGGTSHDNTHSVSDWLIFMRIYLTEAENALYQSSAEDAMDAVRKITAMGVAAMEANGCPKRKK
jgi:hypothetical protein